MNTEQKLNKALCDTISIKDRLESTAPYFVDERGYKWPFKAIRVVIQVDRSIMSVKLTIGHWESPDVGNTVFYIGPYATKIDCLNRFNHLNCEELHGGLIEEIYAKYLAEYETFVRESRISS
jgi:hypothetical protein